MFTSQIEFLECYTWRNKNTLRIEYGIPSTANIGKKLKRQRYWEVLKTAIVGAAALHTFHEILLEKII